MKKDTPTATQKILVIEYLRGLAALAVTCFHLTRAHPPGSAVHIAGNYGWLGVEVFFVISGFVIPYSLFKIYDHYSLKEFPSFVLRRVARLEPPYIASIALVILLAYASAATPGFRGPSPNYSLEQVSAHLFYLIPFTHHGWIQPVYWTLAYEFAFYLFIGLAYPMIGVSGRKIAWAICVGVACTSVVLGGLPPRALLFILGIAIYRSIVLQEHFGWTIAALMFSAGVISIKGGFAIAFVGLATAGAIYFGKNLTLQHQWSNALLWLGTISYSLYLVHVPVGGRVVNLGRRFIEGEAQELALSILAIALSIVFAALFNKLIEKPAMVFARTCRRFRMMQT